MKLFLLFSFVLVGLSFSIEAKSKTSKYYYSLKDHRKAGKKVLLVFAPSKKSKSFQKQLKAFVNKDKIYRNRNTVLYYVFETGSGRADDMILRNTDAQDLRRFFKVGKGTFQMRLLNTKGKTLWKKATTLTAEQLKAQL